MLLTSPATTPNTALSTWTDIASIAAAVGTLCAALLALWAIFQTRRLTTEKAQPYVVASLEPHEHVPWVMELVVSNFGQTAATNVNITIDPKPHRLVLEAPTDPDGSESETTQVPLLYPDALSVLVPGQRWGTSWDSIFMRHDDNDLSRQYTVTLTYEGIKGKQQPSTEYVLDWQMYFNRGHMGFKTMSNIGDDIAGIRTAFEKMVGPNLVHEVVLRDPKDAGGAPTAS